MDGGAASRKLGATSTSDGGGVKQPKCECGWQESHLEDCGDNGICLHGRQTHRCRDYDDSSILVRLLMRRSTSEAQFSRGCDSTDLGMAPADRRCVVLPPEAPFLAAPPSSYFCECWRLCRRISNVDVHWTEPPCLSPMRCTSEESRAQSAFLRLCTSLPAKCGVAEFSITLMNPCGWKFRYSYARQSTPSESLQQIDGHLERLTMHRRRWPRALKMLSSASPCTLYALSIDAVAIECATGLHTRAYVHLNDLNPQEREQHAAEKRAKKARDLKDRRAAKRPRTAGPQTASSCADDSSDSRAAAES